MRMPHLENQQATVIFGGLFSFQLGVMQGFDGSQNGQMCGASDTVTAMYSRSSGIPIRR